ncbi:MAG: NUMOD1 domain-containing DNA-binding protein [Candidatus Heimdallarchaeaceae archaeon]
MKYDINGKYLKTYYSISQAARENKINNISISMVCSGKYRKDKNGRYYRRYTAGGFKWEFIN